jgi:hypothetical protein
LFSYVRIEKLLKETVSQVLKCDFLKNLFPSISENRFFVSSKF